MKKRNRSMVLRLLIVAMATTLLSHCQEKDETINKLVSSSDIGRRPASSLQGTLSPYETLLGIDLPLEKLTETIKAVRMVYLTTYKGEQIEASGILIFPEGGGTYPTVSFQHGTIASEDEAPSAQNFDDGLLNLVAAIASTGAIVVYPDYIGFGSSGQVTHPYYVEEYSAGAVVDMLDAARTLLSQLDIKQSKTLYLAGYSQGGYVTMAAHKSIEEKGIPFYELKASYPSSGGYDIKGVRDFFFAQETYDQPFFLAYVAESYRTSYDWPVATLADYFKEPYASRIPTLFDGSLTGSQINSQLTTVIADLVTEGFLTSPDQSSYMLFNNAAEDNSLLDWVPTVEMNMYHGDADITVPYQNSVDVFNGFTSNGVSNGVISFTPLSGADHFTGFIPYYQLFLTDFLTKEGK